MKRKSPRSARNKIITQFPQVEEVQFLENTNPAFRMYGDVFGKGVEIRIQLKRGWRGKGYGADALYGHVIAVHSTHRAYEELKTIESCSCTHCYNPSDLRDVVRHTNWKLEKGIEDDEYGHTCVWSAP